MDEHKIICPICRESFTREEMIFSRDCHGIPFRLVCQLCNAELMRDRGFDGEYYTEADECLDEDY